MFILDYPTLLFGALLLIYLSITLIILDMENKDKEDVFIDTIHWYGLIIRLGDEIIVETKDGTKEGFFRGLITGKQWIFRLSCEGNSRIEYRWQDVLSIKRVGGNYIANDK